jgi:hypothetical protein
VPQAGLLHRPQHPHAPRLGGQPPPHRPPAIPEARVPLLEPGLPPPAAVPPPFPSGVLSAPTQDYLVFTQEQVIDPRDDYSQPTVRPRPAPRGPLAVVRPRACGPAGPAP